MGRSLAEYAVQHPQQGPERERQAIAELARSYQDRQQEREAVEQLLGAGKLDRLPCSSLFLWAI